MAEREVKGPDEQKVRALVEAMRQSLRDFDDDFSVAELMSAEVTLILATSKVVLEHNPAMKPVIRKSLYVLLSQLGMLEH